MFAKRNSIFLSLLSTAFIVGCGGDTARQYDVPLLLNSKFEAAQTILGKPRKVDFSPVLSGQQRTSYWGESEDAYSVTISYDSVTQMPNMVAFGTIGEGSFTSEANLLQHSKLKMDDPHYKVELKFRPSDSSKCYGAVVTPAIR